MFQLEPHHFNYGYFFTKKKPWGILFGKQFNMFLYLLDFFEQTLSYVGNIFVRFCDILWDLACGRVGGYTDFAKAGPDIFV